jgi:hypothetical protein
MASPKSRMRWPGQDDDPASGSQATLVRVKPNKHRLVLWDEVEAVLRCYWAQTNVPYFIGFAGFARKPWHKKILNSF